MVITFLPRGEGEPFYLGGLVFGLGFIYLGLYLDIGARGPNIVLRLPRSSLVLGEPMRIAYHLTGKVDRVRQLKMAFRAREESTYDEKNHERTVWSITILDSSDPSLIRRGEVTVTLPLEAMPTLVIGDSKIAWTLEVSGPVEGAPDILDVFAVTVEAAPCKSSS